LTLNGWAGTFGTAKKGVIGMPAHPRWPFITVPDVTASVPIVILLRKGPLLVTEGLSRWMGKISALCLCLCEF